MSSACLNSIIYLSDEEIRRTIESHLREYQLACLSKLHTKLTDLSSMSVSLPSMYVTEPNSDSCLLQTILREKARIYLIQFVKETFDIMNIITVLSSEKLLQYLN
ncbi:18948_t:CDS:2 [Entrophospora sp. SA101]|nr:18948_t:CDS:2 [Entrophospora sp. SA101]